MSLNHNKWNTQDENLFVMYDDIIKCPCPQVLNLICSNFKVAYRNFIDFSEIDNMDMKNLLRLSIQRSHINILEYLSIRDFDFAGALKDVMKHDRLLYEKSEPLKMVSSITMLASQKFTKKIYIYTPEYDERVYLDIKNIFKDMSKIVYMTGDFQEAVQALEGITSWFINDITLVPTIFFENKANYTNILIPEYGYNYFYDEETSGDKLKLKIDMDKYLPQHTFKYATFLPHDLDETFFGKA